MSSDKTPMDVLIVGAGGHGRVVADILRLTRRVKIAGFLDANPGLHGQRIDGIKVLGHLNILNRLLQPPKGKRRGKPMCAIVAIGDNRVRKGYAQKLQAAGIRLINAIHPSAVVARSARLGQNIVICANAVVGTASVVGDGVIINTSASVDHECEVGACAHICPGVHLAGRVRIGEGAFIGIGADILPCLNVGDFAIVGGGALVKYDVPAGATAVGVPARVIRSGDPPSPS